MRNAYLSFRYILLLYNILDIIFYIIERNLYYKIIFNIAILDFFSYLLIE